MKVPEIDVVLEAVKRLQTRIAIVEGVTGVGELDKFHTEMQNLVYEIQIKANRLGDGIARAVQGQRSKVNDSAPAYVAQLLAEEDEPERSQAFPEDEPDEPAPKEIPVDDKTSGAENVEVKLEKKDEPKSN